MDEQENNGLKNQESEPEEKQPNSELSATSEAEDGLKNEEERKVLSEITEEAVDELLADGTSDKKEVRIPYKKFQETNEKAKLFEQFSPLLSKLQENPELIDKVMKGESKDSLEAKVARLEER